MKEILSLIIFLASGTFLSTQALATSFPTPTVEIGPHDGESLKVVSVGRVYDPIKWQLIENLTSTNFDIAGTFEKGNYTYVILEQVGLQ